MTLSSFSWQRTRRVRAPPQISWHNGRVGSRKTDVPGGVVHAMPRDLRAALTSDAAAMASWRDITPLARNEWICWVESAKKTETRAKRIAWGCESLAEGKRRPCCWPGCSHRPRRGAG